MTLSYLKCPDCLKNYTISSFYKHLKEHFDHINGYDNLNCSIWGCIQGETSDVPVKFNLNTLAMHIIFDHDLKLHSLEKSSDFSTILHLCLLVEIKKRKLIMRSC